MLFCVYTLGCIIIGVCSASKLGVLSTIIVLVLFMVTRLTGSATLVLIASSCVTLRLGMGLSIGVYMIERSKQYVGWLYRNFC